MATPRVLRYERRISDGKTCLIAVNAPRYMLSRPLGLVAYVKNVTILHHYVLNSGKSITMPAVNLYCIWRLPKFITLSTGLRRIETAIVSPAITYHLRGSYRFPFQVSSCCGDGI